MNRRLLSTYIPTVIAVIILAFYLFPIYWMYATSFKGTAEAMMYPPTLWPQDFTSRHIEVFNDLDMGRYFWNSLVITIGVVSLTVILGTGTAYGLALYRNRWIDGTLFLILVLQALPPSLMVTPLFVLFNLTGLLGTPRLAVVLAVCAKALPFYIIICRTAFLSVPSELREAALVDGASRVGVFFRIVLPLARNAILVSAVLIGIQAMGDYVYSRSFIYDTELMPLTVGLSNFVGAEATNWLGIMTYASILVTPILFVFVVLQRRLVSGLTAGALK
jgi:multiple sugar transport system permease protein